MTLKRREKVKVLVITPCCHSYSTNFWKKKWSFNLPEVKSWVHVSWGWMKSFDRNLKITLVLLTARGHPMQIKYLSFDSNEKFLSESWRSNMMQNLRDVIVYLTLHYCDISRWNGWTVEIRTNENGKKRLLHRIEQEPHPPIAYLQ